MKLEIRAATVADAAAIARIYNQGIEEREATFETRLRTAEEIERSIRETGDRPFLIAQDGDREPAAGQVHGCVEPLPLRRAGAGRGSMGAARAAVDDDRDDQHEQADRAERGRTATLDLPAALRSGRTRRVGWHERASYGHERVGCLSSGSRAI